MMRPRLFQHCSQMQFLLLILSAMSFLFYVFSFFAPADIADHNLWILHFLFITQDRWPCLALAFFFLICLLIAYVPQAQIAPSPYRQHHHLILLGLAFCVVGLSYMCRYVIMDNIDIARDEFLADFDGRIFAAGHLMMPIEPQWQSFYNALQPRLMLHVTPPAYFISFYLPVHAFMRAAWSYIADPALLNPVLAGISVLGTYKIGRSIWPDDRAPALISALLLATSAQLIFMSATDFAMNAHLAANVLWLLCYMRGDNKGYYGCAAIGFMGLGLHQLAFHCVFAFPFIVYLYHQQNYRACLLLSLSYFLSFLFWSDYHDLVTRFMGVEREVAIGNGTTTFLAVMLSYLIQFSFINIWAMLVNVMRFITWQNPALIILSLMAILTFKNKYRPYFNELLAGIVLMSLVLFFAVPFQAWGWGFRYVHMYLFSLCLCAGYGWQWFSQQHYDAAAKRLVVFGTLYCLILILPFYAFTAHNLILRIEKPLSAIAASKADIVLIDASHLRLSYLLSRNRPDLSNRPLTMDIDKLNPAAIDDLCTHYKLAFYDESTGLRFGDFIHPHPDVDVDPLIAHIHELHCAPLL